MKQPLLQIDEQTGELTLDFGLHMENFNEAKCSECGKPIRWVLDMFSFKTNGRGTFSLGHARCLWTKNGFRTQEALAVE